MTIQADYKLSADLIHRPKISVQHRSDEYDEAGFKILLDMQEQHFWYRGRHRFLLAAVDRFLLKTVTGNDVIALSGGGRRVGSIPGGTSTRCSGANSAGGLFFGSA